MAIKQGPTKKRHQPITPILPPPPVNLVLQNVQIMLLEVKYIGLELSEYFMKKNDMIPDANMEYTFNSTFALDKDAKTITLPMDVIIKERQGAVSIELGVLKLSITFKILNLESFTTLNNGVLNVNRGLLVNLVGIVVSTARGMYAVAKLQYPKLSHTFLPLIDPNTMIPMNP